MAMLEGGVGAVATASGHAAQIRLDLQEAFRDRYLIEELMSINFHGYYIRLRIWSQLYQHHESIRWNLQPDKVCSRRKPIIQPTANMSHASVPSLHEEVQHYVQIC
jgi:hypothetical protein